MVFIQRMYYEVPAELIMIIIIKMIPGPSRAASKLYSILSGGGAESFLPWEQGEAVLLAEVRGAAIQNCECLPSGTLASSPT